MDEGVNIYFDNFVNNKKRKNMRYGGKKLIHIIVQSL